MAFWGLLQKTENIVWISRFINPELGIWGTLIAFSILFLVGFYVVFSRKIILSPNVCFYALMLLLTSVFIFSVALTHGESAHSILFFDRKDTYMDFFNSIQYGMQPYRYATIYPPFISAVYGLLGQFVKLKNITEHAYYIRETQIGLVLIVVYYIFVYGYLGNLIFKLKNGNNQEKIILLIIMFFSLPFLFALERGNSVLLALIAIIIFIRFYNSDKYILGIKLKYISYFSLGIAVGIKISPALFVILLIRERKYLETLRCLLIVMAVFLLPFYLTDGNLWTLKNNLEYTISLFQSYQIGDNGELIVIGHGAFVNLINTFALLGKLFNINLVNYGTIFNYIILMLGLLLVTVDKELAKWKALAIITGLLVLYPGFSAVYNLVYFIIPLIEFLDREKIDNKNDYAFAFLFILIFAPILNFRINIFSMFFNDAYPLRLSTFVESVAALLLVVLLEVNSLKNIVCRYQLRLQFFIFVLSFIFVMFNANTLVGKSSVKAFFPENMDMVSAGEGFILQDGQYHSYGKDVTINLHKDDILDKGLEVLLLPDENMQSDKSIKIYCNDSEIMNAVINAHDGGLVYIPPDVFQEFSFSKKFKIRIVDESVEDDSSQLKIYYIGAPALQERIDQSTFIANSTFGLWRYENQPDIFMGKMSEIVLNKLTLEDGLIIKFYVDDKLLLKNPNKNKVLEISCNGKIIKKHDIVSSGVNVAILQPDEIQGVLNDINLISLKINETYRECEYRDLSDNVEKSISILYIGPCDNMVSDIHQHKKIIEDWDNIEDNSFSLDTSRNFFIQSKDIYNENYEIIYEDKLYDSSNINDTLYFIIKLDENNILSRKIKPKSNVDLQGCMLSKWDTKKPSHINKLSLNLSPSAERYDNTKGRLKIKYLGKIQTDKDIVSTDAFNAYVRSEGLKYDKNKKALFFSNFCEILFRADYFDGHNIKIRFETPEFLYMANQEKNVTLKILFDGKLIKSYPISGKGLQEIILSASDYINFIHHDSGYTRLILSMDESYNLSKLKLSGKNSNYDVSMYIFSISK